jgi:hypothetical protein
MAKIAAMKVGSMVSSRCGMIFSIPIEAMHSFGKLARSCPHPLWGSAGRCLPLRLRQRMGVAVVRLGADPVREYSLPHPCPAWARRERRHSSDPYVERPNALTEIGLEHLDAYRGHLGKEAGLVSEHRPALDQRCGTPRAHANGCLRRPWRTDPSLPADPIASTMRFARSAPSRSSAYR